MKRALNHSIVLLVILLSLVHPQVMGMPIFNELHTVLENGSGSTTYTGEASAKFAIVSGGQTLWSNDGSSQNGEMPLNGVKIQINHGMYHCDLGAEPMRPVFTEHLFQFDDLVLKTWIDIGDGYLEMPDRKLSISDFTEIQTNSSISSSNSEPKNTDVLPKLKRSKEVIDSKLANKGKKFAEGAFAEAPADRFRMRWEMKMDEDGEIPFGKILRAKEQIDAMKSRQASINYGVEWEWIGPGNIGGRVRTILFHPADPNRMWIGAASGGIWKTSNGGNHWSPVDDFLPSLNVTSLAMDPNNSNIMYAATGEGFGNGWPDVPGAGIFKSVDGGNTWSQLASTNNNNFSWVTRLAHHPSQSGVLLAATRRGSLNNWNGRVYRSTDGGESWQVVLASTGISYDVKYHKTNPSIVFVGSSLGLWRSTSNGDSATWVVESTGALNKLPAATNRVEIALGTSNPNVVYASLEINNGEIWRSLDAGATWSLRSTGTQYCLGATNQCWYDNAIWVNPMNPDMIVVGGIDLWRSTDGGTTLTQISRWQDYHNGGLANSAHADQHLIIEHPGFNNTTNRVVFVANDGGIQRANNISTVTQNNGWTNLSNNLGITQFYTGAASPNGDIIIGGSQDNSFMYLSNHQGTSSWNQPVTGDGAYCAVDFTNSNNLYASTQRLRILRSTDGGQNWALAINGITEANTPNAPFIAPFVMDPNNPQILVAGGFRVYRSQTGAINWLRIREAIAGNFFVSALAIASGNSQIIWVGYTNGQVSVTTDAGNTWTNIVNFPARRVNAIAINPNNPNEVIVAYAGYQIGNLRRTIDGGATWTQIIGTAPNQLPALPINTVTFSPSSPQNIFIGTDLGIFVSIDSGTSWNVSSYGKADVNPANVEVSKLFWAGEQLIAATHGRGMFKATFPKYIYVDNTAPPGGNGTFGSPFNNVNQAANAAIHHSYIIIKQKIYNDSPVILNKKGLIQAVGGSVTIQ